MAQDYSPGDVLEHVELNNILLAADGWGVIPDPDTTALHVIEKATPGMGVTVEEGHCIIALTEYSEGADVDLVIEASHATLHRKDLITYDPTTSHPVVTKGTNYAGTNAEPIYPPDIPAGDILLAIVAVDAAATTILNADISDARVFIPDVYVYSTRPSDTLLKSNDAEVSVSEASYTLKKTITIPTGIVGGALKMSFDYHRGDAGDTIYVMIYRNGTYAEGAFGTDQEPYQTEEFVIPGCASGDTLQLYAKHDGSGTAKVRNYRAHGEYVKTRLRNTNPTWS